MTGHLARIVIIGAGGYSGAELAELLVSHPRVEIVGLFGSAKREESGKALAFSDSWPRFRGILDLPIRATEIDAVVAMNPDAVFLATPHEASIDLAPQLLAAGLRVLDLSAAYRLKDAGLYPTHYGFDHHDRAGLAGAVYGLPEHFRHEIKFASLVAVPGCYPTASILALAPLRRAGLVRKGTRPIIDAASGVSGAGRTATLKSLFCEVSLQPYNVLKHRHQPEIDAFVGMETLFTPHLVAFDRGILATIHADLVPGTTAEAVAGAYSRAYAAEPFVRMCGAGQWPAVAYVRRTNFCDIGFAVDARWDHAIVASAIDNLTKGAAGQAVQCLNLMLGFDETTGLGGKNGAEAENRGQRADEPGK